MPFLVLQDDDGPNAHIDLSSSKLTLGRSEDNDIVVDHESISDRHAEFALAGGTTTLIDLGSSLGIHVNGTQVTAAILNHGDILQIGCLTLIYQDPPTPSTEIPIQENAPNLLEQRLSRLLPMVRSVLAKGAAHYEKHEETLWFNREHVVFFRRRSRQPLPSEVYEPRPSSLVSILRCRPVGKRAFFRWDDVATVEISPSQIYGNRWRTGFEKGRHLRFTLRTGENDDIYLPEEDAHRCLEALRGVVPQTKLREETAIPPRNKHHPRLISPPFSPELKLLRRYFLAWLTAILAVWAARVLSNRRFDTYHSLTEYLVVIGVITFSIVFLFLSYKRLRAAIVPPTTKWTKGKRERKRRLRNQYKDLSHRRPLRSPLVGRSLQAAGLALYFTDFGHMPGVESFSWISAILWGIIQYVAVTILIYCGYRIALLSADEVVQKDQRPPVVLLRSFDHDGQLSFNAKGFAAQFLGIERIGLLKKLGPLGDSNPLRLLRLLLSRSSDHSEEQLGLFFRCIGPFVTFGKPGEKLALGGAARYYAEDSQWQDAVDRLVHRASVVVLQPGDNEPVWWEIERTFHLTNWRNILFSLLSCEGDQVKYEEFRVRFEERIGPNLPRALGQNVFLYFDQRGPRLLPPVRRAYFTWPLAGTSIHLKNSLAPFLAGRNGLAVSPCRPPGRLRSQFSLLVSVVAWAFLFFVGSAAIHWASKEVKSQWENAGIVRGIDDFANYKTYAGSEPVPYRIRLPAFFVPSETAKTGFHQWEAPGGKMRLMVAVAAGEEGGLEDNLASLTRSLELSVMGYESPEPGETGEIKVNGRNWVTFSQDFRLPIQLWFLQLEAVHLRSWHYQDKRASCVIVSVVQASAPAALHVFANNVIDEFAFE